VTTVNEARRLLQEGRVAEAERAGEAVLERSPDDIEALNLVALAAARSGKPVRAAALLGRATRIDPANPVSFHHLARAHEAAGDLAAALEAMAAALQLKPGFFLARLHYGSLLEHAGRPAPAVLQYARALNDAQAAGQWLDATTTPPGLRKLVEHAVAAVRSKRRSLLFGIAETLAAQFGRDSMARVERCLRVHLGEERAEYPDPRQLPGFLYFPGLPASPYFERSLFPWIDGLEAETGAIRKELLALLPSERGRERVFTSEELERHNLRGTDTPPTWNGYYFWRHGERREDNCAACPASAAAIDRLPLSRVRGHGPEVLFSVFTPGTHLLPHRGVTNTRVVGHLPLVVPADCALSVGGEIHAWQEGRTVVFDDTYEHEAWNRSASTRVILIFDLWNPHLSEAECAAVSAIVEASGELRKSIEALGVS
jgi:aspartate beta-hydroxylase